MKRESINKSGLIADMANDFPDLKPTIVKSAVDTAFDAMFECLTSHNRIEIRGFGSFHVNKHEPRTSRNPKTGDDVQLSTKYRPRFRPGQELRERVNASV